MRDDFNRLECIMSQYGESIIGKDFKDASYTLSKVISMCTSDTKDEITKIISESIYKQ